MQFFCDPLMGQQTEKRTKNTLSYSGMEYIHDDIWYIAESF